MIVRSSNGRRHELSLKRIKLGEQFKVHWSKSRITRHVKLIKVTNKGYNLLDINSNECILYPHLYPHKTSNVSEGNLLFYINNLLNLYPISES